MKDLIKKSQKGGGLLEAALLSALIAVACIASIRSVGESARQEFCNISNQISAGGTSGTGGNNPQNSNMQYDSDCKIIEVEPEF